MNTLTMKDWAVDDQPREKLLKQGEQRLSDAELIAILLRSGCKGKSALDLARQLLQVLGSVRGIALMDIVQSKPIKGFGLAKLAQLKAALELGRRAVEQQVLKECLSINSAQNVADLLLPRMRDLKIEVFKVIFLNAQNHVIAIEDMAQGTVNQVTPIIREIIHKALQHYATAIICVHNHPSGNLVASNEDKYFTRGLMQACQIMNLKLMDHVIIANGGFCSICDSMRNTVSSMPALDKTIF